MVLPEGARAITWQSRPTEIVHAIPSDKPCHTRLKCLFLLLAWLAWPVLTVHAADEPDLIFRRSTVFKWLSPNDKLATYGVDDPEVEGVACHFTVPE